LVFSLSVVAVQAQRFSGIRRPQFRERDHFYYDQWVNNYVNKVLMCYLGIMTQLRQRILCTNWLKLTPDPTNHQFQALGKGNFVEINNKIHLNGLRNCGQGQGCGFGASKFTTVLLDNRKVLFHGPKEASGVFWDKSPSSYSLYHKLYPGGSSKK